MPPIDDFLRDLDRGWDGAPGERLTLHVIGSTALMLQVDYERGTKDSDILTTDRVDANVRQRLLALAGPGTLLHTRHRLYLDVVANGVPFLPHVSRWHPQRELDAGLRNLEILALDVVDVVVSKLKPFRPQDRDDIAAMVDRGLVPHAALLARFRAAADRFMYDARANDLVHYVANLHRVERDLLGVAESEIELPSWI